MLIKALYLIHDSRGSYAELIKYGIRFYSYKCDADQRIPGYRSPAHI